MGEIPTPVPGDGEVLFRALRIGLWKDPESGAIGACGIIAQVVQTGRGVEDIFPGERYAVRSVVGCGECEECLSSRENLCAKAYHTHGFGESGVFAEFFVVPPNAIGRGSLIHLPGDVDPDWNLFIEPLAFSVNGLNHIPIGPSVHTVVIGAGLTGVLCGIVARYRNARRVTICDPDTQRIENLRTLGLPFEAIAGGDEAVSRILADSPGGVQAVVSALPDPGAIRRALALVAVGGHVSFIVPAPAQGAPAIDPAAITRREIHIHGANGIGHEDCIEARHMISEGVVPAEKLISRRFLIQELKAAADLISDPGSRSYAVILEAQPDPLPIQEPLRTGAPVEVQTMEAATVGTEPPPEVSIEEDEAPSQESTAWNDGLSDVEISELARRIREPKFDYGRGSELLPSGEIAPWGELPPEIKAERERMRQKKELLRLRRRGRKGAPRQPARPEAARAPKHQHPHAHRPQRPEPSRESEKGHRKDLRGRDRGRREERPIVGERQPFFRKKPEVPEKPIPKEVPGTPVSNEVPEPRPATQEFIQSRPFFDEPDEEIELILEPEEEPSPESASKFEELFSQPPLPEAPVKAEEKAPVPGGSPPPAVLSEAGPPALPAGKGASKEPTPSRKKAAPARKPRPQKKQAEKREKEPGKEKKPKRAGSSHPKVQGRPKGKSGERAGAPHHPAKGPPPHGPEPKPKGEPDPLSSWPDYWK